MSSKYDLLAHLKTPSELKTITGRTSISKYPERSDAAFKSSNPLSRGVIDAISKYFYSYCSKFERRRQTGGKRSDLSNTDPVCAHSATSGAQFIAGMTMTQYRAKVLGRKSRTFWLTMCSVTLGTLINSEMDRPVQHPPASNQSELQGLPAARLNGHLTRVHSVATPPSPSARF